MAADTHAGDGGARRLKEYWAHGEGLAKWASSAHPYETLVALLSKYVPDKEAHGLAANIYHEALGHWPGRKNGGKH